jgi:hypothetical protein
MAASVHLFDVFSDDKQEDVHPSQPNVDIDTVSSASSSFCYGGESTDEQQHAGSWEATETRVACST